MEAALIRARQNTTTAALVLALVPLAAMPALAGTESADGVSITTTLGTDLNGATITYAITNNSGYSLSEIEIPEINAGDLKFRVEASEQPGTIVNSLGPVLGAPFLPGGWSGTQNSTAQLGSSVPGGTPSDFLDLTTNFGGAQIPGGGGTGSFTFDVTTTSTVEADIAVDLPNANGGSGAFVIIDPPIVNTAAPEPTSLALLGTALAGMISARRRRKT